MPAFNLTPTGAEPITKGKLVAFYAAQTIETTPEMPLPKGTAGRRALRPVHLHHLFQARRKPERHLSPARPGGAAAIFGRQPHAPDAAVRGRARRARVRHREDRRDHAVADRRQERRRHDRRRPAAPADAGHQARHPAVGAVADIRCARLSRGAVGEEPGEPGEAGRVRRQAGAEARRHSGQRLCPGCRARRRLQARRGAAVGCRGPRRRGRAGQFGARRVAGQQGQEDSTSRWSMPARAPTSGSPCCARTPSPALPPTPPTSRRCGSCRRRAT